MELCFFFENPLQKLFSFIVYLFIFFLFRGVVIEEFVGRGGAVGNWPDWGAGPNGVHT